MYDLNTFSLDDMIRCCAALRVLGTEARGMDEAAERIVRFLYESLCSARSGERCCALVRFYETIPFGELDVSRRRFASDKSGRDGALKPETPCLCLRASAGDEREWNRPAASARHFVIPLPSEEALSSMPMISRLFAELGVESPCTRSPEPAVFTEWAQRTYDVFHVEHAAGSPYVPAQKEFVDRYGIESVVGCGGVLPNGRAFALILFSKVPVPVPAASLFRPLALAVKLAILPCAFTRTAVPGHAGEDREVAAPCIR
jgi:hypothetical protein